MAVTALSTLVVFSCLILTTILWGRYSYIPILQMGKPRHRAVLYFLKVSQLVEAESGFKSSPDLPAWSETMLFLPRASSFLLSWGPFESSHLMSPCPLPQVPQEVSHLHQREPAHLHRPGGERQGCRGLAWGWTTPLPHAGRRAGGVVPAGRPPAELICWPGSRRQLSPPKWPSG